MRHGGCFLEGERLLRAWTCLRGMPFIPPRDLLRAVWLLWTTIRCTHAIAARRGGRRGGEWGCWEGWVTRAQPARELPGDGMQPAGEGSRLARASQQIGGNLKDQACQNHCKEVLGLSLARRGARGMRQQPAPAATPHLPRPFHPSPAPMMANCNADSSSLPARSRLAAPRSSAVAAVRRRARGCPAGLCSQTCVPPPQLRQRLPHAPPPSAASLAAGAAVPVPDIAAHRSSLPYTQRLAAAARAAIVLHPEALTQPAPSPPPLCSAAPLTAIAAAECFATPHAPPAVPACNRAWPPAATYASCAAAPAAFPAGAGAQRGAAACCVAARTAQPRWRPGCSGLPAAAGLRRAAAVAPLRLPRTLPGLALGQLWRHPLHPLPLVAAWLTQQVVKALQT
jgi:hypothetical protein